MAGFGDSATSDKDEVPGLCLIFFDGEGLSEGPGVSDVRLNLVLGSSILVVSTML